MKRLLSVLFILGLFISTNIHAQPEYRVKNAEEFFKAIGSDRIIILQTAIYNLSEAAYTKNERVTWLETFDGLEPQISKVRNMSIKAEIDVKMLIEPRYSWVLRFDNCKNISIENFTMGHTAGGYCSGGVLRFSNSEDITLTKCILFGCGTEGLYLENVKKFNFIRSTIRECSYDLLSLINSQDVLFDYSIFTKTGQFELINITTCSNVVFSHCSITKNHNSTAYIMNLFNISGKCSGIEISNSTIKDNRVRSFANDENKIIQKNNKIRKNDFQKKKVATK
jgi:hypothetical protein